MSSVFQTVNYKFTLNGNGGIFPDHSVIVDKNRAILPVPTQNGYIFSGYSTTINGTVSYNQSISNISNINNKALYAKWKTETYAITYHLNGGTVSGQKKQYTIEDTFKLPTPTKVGHDFLGWTTSTNSVPQKELIVSKGTFGNLEFTANWKVNTFVVDVNPIVQNVVYNAGLDSFTFSVWINGKQVADHVKDYYKTVDYASQVRILVHNREGYTIKSFTDKTYTVTSNLNINPSWYDDIPPTITNFFVQNLGYYDPSVGALRGWNIRVFVDGYDSGTGIQKFQTWLKPYGNGSGASRTDGNDRTLTRVLYLEEPSGRTFCAYAIDKAGNEASRCETIHAN